MRRRKRQKGGHSWDQLYAIWKKTSKFKGMNGLKGPHTPANGEEDKSSEKRLLGHRHSTE